MKVNNKDVKMVLKFWKQKDWCHIDVRTVFFVDFEQVSVFRDLE